MNTRSRLAETTEIKELLISLVGNAPIGILAFDMELRCILANSPAGRVFSVKPEKLVDISFNDILSHWHGLRERLPSNGLARRASFTVEEVAFKERVYNVQGRALVNGFLVTIHDISAEIEHREKQHELVNKLERANEELAEFAYICAHDMKSPVSNVIGLIELVSDSLSNDSESKEVVDLLSESANKLHRKLRSLNDILTYKKSLGTSHDTCNVYTVIGEVLGLLAFEIKAIGASIDVVADKEMSVCVSDTHLHSILSNLISNALKYRHEDRRLTVRLVVTQKLQNTIITVIDNGVGIDNARDTSKIFGLFNRLHTHVEGEGVGLYLVKSIVDSYSGSVSVISDTTTGSIFNIELPNDT